ncbi:MAG: nicotinate phosphoribosyltransferase [Trizodia sp. TS-e1964]|nr:MAG: nicotinate phosphoribosyltransferase [Trizodia sp. TS-e1964]
MEGVNSILDTDLYKLTMQCVVLKYFPEVEVTYAFTNRTKHLRLNRPGFEWLQQQVDKLSQITLSPDELAFLKTNCKYLDPIYLDFLCGFRFCPKQHIKLSFTPISGPGGELEAGDLGIEIRGLWADTILYEIPLLSLTSEAYFKHVDRDWDYSNQREKATEKAHTLRQNGCNFAEFGSRRRRDYHTQDLVLQGLCDAFKTREAEGLPGKLTGTSNVHFAMKHGITPVGTVAHEWFMGIAAATGSYHDATLTALRCWVNCFGEGVLDTTLTDTFGTPAFLGDFGSPYIPSADSEVAQADPMKQQNGRPKSFAEIFSAVRQDSGNPLNFVKTMRKFYDDHGIKTKKTIVFSDALNVDLCIQYAAEAKAAGFHSSFGIGTFLTNDFINMSTGNKSTPLNVVIKLSSAAGRPAIKLSDNVGKNTGDPETVEKVKRMLDYKEEDWRQGNESNRWGVGNDQH